MVKRVLLGLLLVLSASSMGQSYRYDYLKNKYVRVKQESTKRTRAYRSSFPRASKPSWARDYSHRSGAYAPLPPLYASSRPRRIETDHMTKGYRKRDGTYVPPHMVGPSYRSSSRKAKTRKNLWGKEIPPYALFQEDKNTDSRELPKAGERTLDRLLRGVGPGTKANSEAPSAPSSTVYVTPSGHSYHRAGCSSLSRSKNVRSISAQDARNRGLKPCSRCQP